MERPLKKRPTVHEKRDFRMQLYIRREGAKTREDLLKCKYIPPASDSPDYLEENLRPCKSVPVEVG